MTLSYDDGGIPMLETLFDPENPLMRFLNKVIDLFSISIVWTISCIPIITIGPACAALYYAVVKSVRRDRGHIVKEFFYAFKSNFKRGAIGGLIWAAFALMMVVTDVPLFLTFLNTGAIQDIGMLVLFSVKTSVLMGMACWLFPVISRFEQSLLKSAQISLVVMIQNIPRTIISIILVSTLALLIIAEPLLLAVLPSVIVLLLSFLIEPVLKKICQTAETDPNDLDLWYLE